MIFDNIKEFANKIEKGRPLVGLDLGSVKVGIAVSDTEHLIASPREVYIRRNIAQDLGHINKLANDEKACGFVVGLPLALDGTEGENCVAVRHFAEKLYKKTGLPVFLQDERMSTSAATRALSESGMTRKKRQSLDDKVAAGYILQGVLDIVACF